MMNRSKRRIHTQEKIPYVSYYNPFEDKGK